MSAQQQSTQAQQIMDSILFRVLKEPGRYGIAIKSLNGPGTTMFYEADDIFHAASTMKAAVLVELYRQASNGFLNLDDTVTVVNSFTSIQDGSTYALSSLEDSGDTLYSLLGKPVTYRFLAEEMITVSSNLATNILINILSAESVMASLAELGIEGVTVLRGVEDQKAFDAGKNNTVTAKGLMQLFEEIELGNAVAPQYRQEVLDIFLRQKMNALIPKGLPADARVAHKTGSITKIMHDAGIVYLPGGKKYVIALLAADFPDEAKCRDFLAEISAMVYRLIMAG